MPRHRLVAFITPGEICALLADEAPKHAAEVYCHVARPTPALVRPPLSTLGALVDGERVRELHLTLANAGPDHPQDFHFALRNRREIVRFELGESESGTVEPTMIVAEPEGIAMVLLRDFEHALSRLCHHYVRIPETRRLQKIYWSPALAGRNLLGREAVVDEVSKLERAAASAKRRPKWKLR